MWNRTEWKLCADGGANRLFDSFPELLPTAICGDLDSIRKDVKEYYLKKGVLLVKIHDQNATDLQKCFTVVRWLERSVKADVFDEFIEQGPTSEILKKLCPTPEFPPDKVPSHVHDVIILGALNGRFDHTMASFNTLFLLRQGKIHEDDGKDGSGIPDNRRVYLTSDTSIAFLLWKGTNRIHCFLKEEGPAFGLMPLATKRALVVTRGLKWNLDHSLPLEFGGMVSTSNTFADATKPWTEVTVETDESIIVSVETHMEPIRQW
jgi:thiamine pyrophosphokinase